MQVTMADLKMMAVLGIGAFGRVTLVKHHKALYALKAMCKHHVIEKNMLAHVNREKGTMKDLNCPFTVRLQFHKQLQQSMLPW
jgi:serine/threonine protein kinase